MQADTAVPDVLVRSRRDKHAAERLLLKKRMRPLRVVITDKLASSGASEREIMPGVEHRRQKGLNSRAENPHRPIRRRERQMKRFKSPGEARCFLSAHGRIADLVYLRRDAITSVEYRAARTRALGVGAELSGVTATA